MKKYLCALMCMFTILISCGGGEEDNNGGLISTNELLNPSESSITLSGTVSKSFNITADCAWTISCDGSWLNISPSSGTNNATITVSANAENPSSQNARSATLTIKSISGKVSRMVTVTQNPAGEVLTTNENELSFIPDGETKTLSIQSNGKWNISGAEDWISLSQENGNGNADIRITVAANPTETLRMATLTVLGSNNSVQVKLKQAGIQTSLILSPTTISAASVGGTYELIVSGDANWTASSSDTWCLLDKHSGKGDGTITVTCNQNISGERTAMIKVSSSQRELTCKVMQAAASAPTVSAVSVSDIQRYSFSVSATYQSDYDIIASGFCYSLNNSTPSTSDNVVKNASGKDGIISATISNLNSGKTYYVRAYATSAVGTSYGETKKVATLGSKPGSGDNPTPDK